MIFSNHANDSTQVMREVERAVHKGLVVIPFRIEEAVPTGSLEYFLSTAHWLDGFPRPLAEHLETLASSIQHHLNQGGGGPGPLTERAIERKQSAYRRPGMMVLAVLIVVGLIGALMVWMRGPRVAVAGKFHETSPAVIAPPPKISEQSAKEGNRQ